MDEKELISGIKSIIKSLNGLLMIAGRDHKDLMIDIGTHDHILDDTDRNRIEVVVQVWKDITK